jgi:hypothetical protein
MGLTCFAGLGWAAWLTRNKICMQKSFPAKPIEVIYNALSFVQKWQPLMKPLEEVLENLMTSMTTFARSFKLRESNPSDVGFI